MRHPKQHSIRVFLGQVLGGLVVLTAIACSNATSDAARPTVPGLTPTARPILAGPPTASAQPLLAPTAGTAANEGTVDQPFAPRTKDGDCRVHDGLPDGACTPGAVFPDVTAAQVCQRGYSAAVRNVPAALSREVYREYGIVERTTGEYEVDHLVPLEAGGSNDIANLWPQAAEPRPGFHEKDVVENYAHDQACGGTLSLLEVQRAIAANWIEVYQRVRPPATVAPAPQATVAPALPDSGVLLPLPVPVASLKIMSVSGARPGGRATLSAQTSPGATCTISYRTPAGTLSVAQGLTAKTANADGAVAWFWDIGPSTRAGTGSVVVTCNGQSERSAIQIG